MRILVVEDDRKVASFLERGLKEEGYAVDVAHDGVKASVNAHIYDYDMLLLDVMLPGKSGLEVLRELRARGSNVPVMMLTARDATEDLVQGLDLGADDYLTKPFRFDVLLARIRALLRRGGAAREERLLYDDVELDRLTRTARRAGDTLDLTPREFQLLEYFLLRPETVVRRTELLEKVWDMHFDPGSNVVDVHVANLRRKLRREDRPELLQTMRGVGYVLHREPQE
jgi:DNA-binding response OmpR family regulator